MPDLSSFPNGICSDVTHSNLVNPAADNQSTQSVCQSGSPEKHHGSTGKLLNAHDTSDAFPSSAGRHHPGDLPPKTSAHVPQTSSFTAFDPLNIARSVKCVILSCHLL